MTGAAPIYSLDHKGQAEAIAWAQFSAPKDSAEFCASWLSILCGQIEQVNAALVVLGPDPDGGYSAAGVWPDPSVNVQYLGPTAEAVLKERRGLVQTGTSGVKDTAACFVGYPIDVSGDLRGAVVLDLQSRSDAKVQQALRLLHWASAWLIDQFRQQALADQRRRTERQTLVNDVLATALQEPRLGPSALSVVNDLASRLACDRVSLGLERDGQVEVMAISHTATFDRRSDLVRLIGDAMDETLDLDAPVVVPPLSVDAAATTAHDDLAEQHADTAVCSVPLVSAGHAIGVLTLERVGGKAFDQHEFEVCQAVGLMLGPVIDLKQQHERGFWRRGRDALHDGAAALFGPHHPGVKLMAALAVLVLVFFSLATGTYRVTARTVIEGEVQHAAAAPFAGFIAESHVRAGSTVRKGQIMARLDDRELRLERARWAAELEQMQRRYRQAAANMDRAAMAVTSAQSDQAQAQLALVEEKMERAVIRAPFDGLVVEGDLSQQQGAPVEQGKVLFEVAPLKAYRVILQVDERDISAVQVGQSGKLALSGIPYETLDVRVSQLTPMAIAQDGRNFFRVEATLDKGLERLRPGMEGISKVQAGERKLIWIWTHSFVDWLRLWTWRWTP